MHRLIRVLFVTILIVALAAPIVRANVSTPFMIESQMLVTGDMPPATSPYGLGVQATSWLVGQTYRYVITVINLSPWPMTSLRFLDRYLASTIEKGEIDHQWFPRRLEPGHATTYVIEFPNGPLSNGCHQLELSLADGFGTILMDCSTPGATTVWNVPLTKELEAHLSRPPLTRDDPTGRSKLGVHVTRNNSPKIMEFVRVAYPAVVVAVGDLSWLADVKAASPKTVTLGRLLEGSQAMEGDPVKRAQEFVSANAGTYLATQGVDYWLGWNEPVVKDAQQMAWYTSFEVERVNAMAKLGLKVAVGNFATGTPEPDEFKAFLPALEAAKKHGGILALHEYSAPTMQAGVGAGIPGLDATDEQGALTLRYRFWYDYYLRPNDLVLPLVITEAGIDGGVIKGGKPGMGGWRDFARVPDGAPSADASADYRGQLSWYDDQLRRDPYVLGFAVFTAGPEDERWKSFDITDILPQLADLVNSKK